jgi:hypothetical protein
MRRYVRRENQSLSSPRKPSKYRHPLLPPKKDPTFSPMVEASHRREQEKLHLEHRGHTGWAAQSRNYHRGHLRTRNADIVVDCHIDRHQDASFRTEVTEQRHGCKVGIAATTQVRTQTPAARSRRRSLSSLA